MRKILKPLLLLSLLSCNTALVHAAPGEKYPQTKTRVLSTTEVANLNREERRYAINEMYARHGLLFGDMALRKQFLKFPWYKPQPGRTMAQVRASFSRTERLNIERLGLAREMEMASTKADDYEDQESYISPYAGTAKAWSGEHFPETRLTRLDEADVDTMNEAQKRYARNEIYARHGYLFQTMALRKQFLGFSWYKPKPGRSMSRIAATMTPIERANLAALSVTH